MRYIFVFLCIGWCLSFTSQSAFTGNPNIPVFSDHQGDLLKRLEAAYRDNKPEAFFAQWKKEIGPNTKAETGRNDTVKSLYDIFRCFYHPTDLTKLGDWEWGNGLNTDTRYVVIQNRLYYRLGKIMADMEEDYQAPFDSVVDFRPQLNISETGVLYLSTNYEKTINQFLGTQSTRMGEGNIMNPSMPKGESEKRYKWLRKFIPVLHGHWSGYWHLSTHPEVGQIVLDPGLKKAMVYFRVGYQGGEASLVKVMSTWILLNSRSTWIE